MSTYLCSEGTCAEMQIQGLRHVDVGDSPIRKRAVEPASSSSY
jgi:hypothetical protein